MNKKLVIFIKILLFILLVAVLLYYSVYIVPLNQTGESKTIVTIKGKIVSN